MVTVNTMDVQFNFHCVFIGLIGSILIVYGISIVEYYYVHQHAEFIKLKQLLNYGL